MLLDVDDDVGASPISDLSLPSEDEDEEVKLNNIWEHAIDILFTLKKPQKMGQTSKHG